MTCHSSGFLSIEMNSFAGYEQLEKVCDGAQSSLFEALDSRSGEVVALKVLREEFSNDSRVIAAFRQHSEAISRIDHPNVIRVLDTGEHSGLPFMSMEYLPTSLLDLLYSHGRIPVHRALEIALQASRGLEALWHHNTFHRDIRPRNILLSPDGTVKLAGFGLPYAVDSLTLTLADPEIAIEIAHYLSPEQIEGAKPDIRSDLYSLGVVIYRMLTGEFPFNGAPPSGVIQRILRGNHSSVRQLAPELNEEVSSLIDRLLSRDASERFQTPTELKQVIESAMQSAGGALDLKRIGKYPLVREIGSGSQAIVYLGVNEETRQQVAVKVLHPHLTGNTSSVERFVREARLAVQLDSHYVVQILDHGYIDGRFYIAMEYIQDTLRDRIRKNGALTEAEVLQIALDVCEGLEEAERSGMIHRDIKPENIMLTAGNRAKIADFGIARGLEATSMTLTGYPMGTPAYMSPEQVQGEHVDIRSDLYSLGIVLYEMVAGATPFKSSNPWNVLRLQQEASPPDIEQVRPDLSPELRQVIERLLEKNPEERYQTPQALRIDLEALQSPLKALPSAGPALPHAGSIFLRSQRGRVFTGLLALIIVVGTLIAIPFLLKVGRAAAPVILQTDGGLAVSGLAMTTATQLPSRSETDDGTALEASSGTPISTSAPEMNSTSEFIEVFVPANTAWISTGVSVDVGEFVEVQASGLAQYTGTGYSTPDGISTQGVLLNAGDSNPTDAWAAKRLPALSLVARVGESGAPIYIGNLSAFNAPQAGKLYLSMNDMTDTLFDNSGGWTAVIRTDGFEKTGEDFPPEISGYRVVDDGAGVVIEWIDSSEIEAGYAIFRKEGLQTEGTGKQVATVGPNQTQATVGYLKPGTTECFFIRSFDSYGLRLSSGLICVDLPPTGTVQIGPGEATPLPSPRISHASIAVGDYIYVIGGSGKARLSSVLYARINPDGSLGDWVETSPLQDTRLAMAVAVSGEYIYILGGDTDYLATSVEFARINPDGTLGRWENTTPLTSPVTSARAVGLNGRIYVVGGFTLGPEHPSVTTAAFAEVNPESGSLGSWQATSSMVEPRAEHGLVAADDHLFAIGGWNNAVYQSETVFYSSVERASVNPDGALGSWEVVSHLTMPRTWHGTALAYPYIFAIGGSPDFGQRTASVEFSTLDGEGGLSTWKRTDPMSIEINLPTAQEANGAIYVIGGHDGEKPLNTVTRIRVESPGD